MMKALLSLVLTLMIGFIEASEDLNVVISDFSEEFNPEVNVSGGVLIGFQLSGSAATPDLNKLYIARPNDVESINLSLTSMDGKYKAQMRLKFGDSQSTWTEVSIPSKRTEELGEYSVNELVAYAYNEVVDERSKRKRTFHMIYPTSWGFPEKPENFNGRFFVNSGIALPKYILNKEHFECVPTKAEINTAFNKFCALTDEFEAGNNLIFLKAGVQRKFLVWRP